MFPIDADDQAGAALLGVGALPDQVLGRLAIDTPRAVLINTLNRLIDMHNKLYANGAVDHNFWALASTTILDEVAATSQTITTSFTDITNWSGTFDCKGGALLFFLEFTWWCDTAAGPADFRLVLDGVNYPSSTGFSIYTNETGSHKFSSRTLLATHDAAEGITVKLQGKKATGNLKVDSQDKIRLTVLELPELVVQ